ncbi:MAG TPA: endonuclease/exonuclease/phosphatase family protein [Phycisphaerae bacterium]|nr:endonuclease/exonuclease/phosphatase family protein [Phycisphaerae bacterium]
MRFRILTYNIHKAIGVDGVFAPQRILEILRHHDADIVLLQEVDRAAPRSNHLDLGAYFSRELSYPHRAVSMNVHMKKGKYGNATLSRYAIGRQRNINLTIGQHKRRGAQHTRILVQSSSASAVVDVFNVHLSLRAKLRRQQIQMLLESGDLAGVPACQPCIIAGDMNDWPGSLKRQRFGPADFVCASGRRPGSRWAIKTFPSYAPTAGLDKVFYRGEIKLLQVFRSRLKLARVASDHLPVIADFEVSPNAN